MYIYHHHHYVVPQAWISLTLSRHFSLSFIASGRSSRPHPVSPHSYWMYVRAGCPTFAWPYVGVHRSTSLMSLLPSNFFSNRLVSIQVVHPFSSIDTTAAWKKLHFIFSVRSDFHMIDSLSIAVHIYIYMYIYIYIYIYIYFFKKNETGDIRIINLFPSYHVFLIKSKNTKKKLTGLLQILWKKKKIWRSPVSFFFFVFFDFIKNT